MSCRPRGHDEQIIKLGQVFGRKPSYKGIGRSVAGTRPAAIAMRSITAAPGRTIPAVRRVAMTAAAVGCPWSALCAAPLLLRSSDHRIIGGKSAMVGVRRPKMAASWRAWSVMVCGRGRNRQTRRQGYQAGPPSVSQGYRLAG